MTGGQPRWAAPKLMSLSDVYWLKYPVAALVLIGLVGILGLPPFLIVRRRVPSWALMLAPNLGIAWVIVLASWYARLDTSLPWWVVWGTFALILIGLGVASVRGALLSTLRAGYRGPRGAAATTLGLVAPWVLGVAAVTAFLLPMVSSPFQPAGYVTAYTFGNNDIGTYVAYASNIVRAGFGDAGLYYGWNPGTNASLGSASTDHAGASALLAFNAVTLGAPVWKVAEISIMVAMAAMFTAAVALVRGLLPRSPRGALAIAALGTMSFMVWYLVGNYFLAHIICLSMVLSQLAVIVLARDRLLDWRVLFTLVPLAAATWLTSPELQFVLALLVAALIGGDFVASLVTGVPGAVRALLARTVAVVLSVGIAALTILPFTTSLITRSRIVYTTKGGVGWLLDLQNSALVLFGYPDPIGSHNDLGWFAAAALGILLLGCLAWALVHRDRLGIGAGVFGIVLVATSAYGAQRWGWTTYQSWKLTLSLSIPFLIFAGLLVIRPLSADNRRVALAIIVGLVCINIAVGAQMWGTVRGTAEALADHSINNALVTVLQDPKVQRQDGLNINIPTLFNTAIAPSIYGKRAAMWSPSYVSNGQPGPHPYTCSLVEARLYERKMGKIVYTTHGFHLVAKPRCA